jgi:hypothetical protein
MNFKRIALALLIVIVVIQFIQPEKNVSGQLITDNDISKTYAISEDVHQLLISKCYDCHSNNTHYPWYNNIQPVGWWMNHHVEEGKSELNFSEFKTYPEKRALHKLEEIGEMIDENAMPLKSYLWLHPETEVTAVDKEAIHGWLRSLPIPLKEN